MAQLDIEDEVKADLIAFTAIQPVGVYHYGDVPLDEQLPSTDGLIDTRVVIHPGSPATASVGKGILGPEKDPINNYFILEVIGPNRDMVRDVGQLIDNRYLGLTLGGSTKFSLGRAASWSAGGESGSATPRPYHRAITYRYLGNL